MIVSMAFLAEARQVDRVEPFFAVGDECDVGNHDDNLGMYAANRANCSEYLQCLHGEFVARPCPEGLHWDEVEEACNWAIFANCQVGLSDVGDDSVRTYGNVRPRAPTVEYQLPIAYVDEEEERPIYTECPEIDPMTYSVFLPHPACDHYYACSNGVPIEMECPEFLEWNRQKNVCDWPIDAGCVAGSASSQ